MALDRKPHPLKENKSTFRPCFHIFVDVESHLGVFEDNWRDHTFRLGQALFWRRRTGDEPDKLEWFYFNDPEKFWLWATDHVQSSTRLVLVSHNLNYDLVMLDTFRLLPGLGWELTKFYAEHNCKIFNWRKGKKTIQCLDNANWFKGTLASWGETVGYPKLEVDFETVEDNELATYCKRDVEILYQLWVWWYKFLDDNDCGAWGITVPSQAFNTYRHNFMDFPIWIHNEQEVLELERESYRGGRVECFRQGFYEGDTYYKLDVNSMYPFVMWMFPYPTMLVKFSKDASLKHLKYHLDRQLVIARVGINCDEPWFPVKIGERTGYPTGKFETVLTTAELRSAFDHGWIEYVKEMAWYRSGFIFRSYVDYWYRFKTKFDQAGEALHYRLTKLFLNSLYGKFGQQANEMIEIGSCDPNRFEVNPIWDTVNRVWRTEYYIAGKVYLSQRIGDSFHAFPAIAAHVTANARIYLYKLVNLIGRDLCYYCDTDSVITNQEGYEKVAGQIKPYQLGHLKIEAMGENLSLFAPKDYILGGEAKIKGVKKDAVWLTPETIEQEIFPSIKGLMHQKRAGVYRTKRQIKRLNRKIKTGFVDHDGVVHPLELGALI